MHTTGSSVETIFIWSTIERGAELSHASGGFRVRFAQLDLLGQPTGGNFITVYLSPPSSNAAMEAVKGVVSGKGWDVLLVPITAAEMGHWLKLHPGHFFASSPLAMHSFKQQERLYLLKLSGLPAETTVGLSVVDRNGEDSMFTHATTRSAFFPIAGRGYTFRSGSSQSSVTIGWAGSTDLGGSPLRGYLVCPRMHTHRFV